MRKTRGLITSHTIYHSPSAAMAKPVRRNGKVSPSLCRLLFRKSLFVQFPYASNVLFGLRYPASIDGQEQPEHVRLLHVGSVQLAELNHDVKEVALVIDRQLKPGFALVLKTALNEVHNSTQTFLPSITS
jgi:hypothetical protein